MKRIKKLSIISLMVIFLVLSIGCLLLFSEPNPVFATTTTYFSDEKYTSNDYLLLPDGTKSSKKIGEYAAEITAADYGTTFDDLGQIIPLQYLNSTVSEATFKYYGEEYGFYVVKEG